MLSSLQAACSAASAIVQPTDTLTVSNASFNASSSSTVLRNKFNTIIQNDNDGGSKKLMWNPPRRYATAVLENKTTIYGKNNNKWHSNGDNLFGAAVQRAASLKYSTTIDEEQQEKRRFSTTNLTTTFKQQRKLNDKKDEPEFAVITESPKAQQTSFCSTTKDLMQPNKSLLSVPSQNNDFIWSKRCPAVDFGNDEPPNEPPPPLPIKNNEKISSNNNSLYNNNFYNYNNNIKNKNFDNNNHNNNKINNDNQNNTLLRLLNSNEEIKKRNSFYDQNHLMFNQNFQYNTMSLQRTPTTTQKQHSKLKEPFENCLIATKTIQTWNINESPSIKSIIPIKNRINAYCDAAKIQRPIQSEFLQPLKMPLKQQPPRH